MVSDPGHREGVEQFQVQCFLSSPKWQNKCEVWHYHVEEALVFCLTNVIDLFVHPL